MTTPAAIPIAPGAVLRTLPTNGVSIRLQFLDGQSCVVTRTAVDAKGAISATESVQASWTATDGGLRVTIGDHSGDYALSEGVLQLGRQQWLSLCLQPLFPAAMGPLEPGLLFPAAAVDQLETLARQEQRPRGLLAMVVTGAVRVVQPLPWWLRAPVVTATVLAALVSLRALGKLDRLSGPGELAALGRAVGGAALAGAAGASVATLLLRPLRRLGYFGDLLNGVVTVNSYLIACTVAFERWPKDGRAWGILLAVGSVMGLALGQVVFRQLSCASAQRPG
jgi:hypothetical protein